MASKKTSKKSSRRQSSASKTPGQPGDPRKVSTGPGRSAEDIGKQVVADFNRGKFGINPKLWSPRLVSIEGGGLAWHGLKNVEAKNSQWNAANRVLGASAEGPFVGATGFAIKFRMDVEDKQTNHRTIMEEVGVYAVRNGKIVQEEFMYGSMTPAEAILPRRLSAL